MNSQELRIGNCLYDPEENENIFIEGVDIFLIQMGHRRESKYEPIKLTKEIIMKCGFEPTYFVCDNKLASYRIKNKDFINPDFTLVWYGTKIEYLHQLQNLYFSLTQQELIIEL
ncbi:hypothetical protein [Empedobacter brevis]|uniref:hypothetical protein n=1 Tax=Empedobacter brevis TaxID=247 RepID=UPI0028AA44B9|nr:hypothetical protein [Empedobacter brevis]